MNNFEDSILRVLKGDMIVGAAFLVSDRVVATCAHVVEFAGVQVGGKISLRFSNGKDIEAIVEPNFWRDPNAEDISVLRLNEPIGNIQPISLGTSSGTKGHNFSTFGFPKQGQDLSGGGKIIGQATIDGIRLLQLDSRQVTPGFSGAPIFDEVTKRVVGMVVAITPPDEYQRLGTTAFAISSETIRQICPELQISDICPYRSLEVFTEEDAPFFFGRERVVQKMIDSLKREPRFLAVVGPSGSGKSSVVRAGLLPALKQGKVPNGDKWGVITIRPANQPFEHADSAGLSKSQDGLEKAVRSWLESNIQKRRFVLVIDQFEEVLVSTPEIIRQKFISELGRLLNASIPITVVITLRDDFYSRFLHDAAPLTGWLERGLVNIPTTLDNDELRAMVTKPAKEIGLTFEEGLVDDILDDAADADRTKGVARSTILPLLEFALTQLWEKQWDGWLTHDVYHAIGGVTGGLTQWADRAYYALNTNEQKLAESIFCELVHLGDEKEQTPDTRRVQPINRLGVREQKNNIEIMASKLVQARLLSTQRDLKTGQEFIEIIHEALLREWGLLKTWLDDFRNLERIAQQRRQLRVSMSLAVGLIATIGIALFAGLQWRRAEQQAQIAFARQLAANSQLVFNQGATGPFYGSLLATESLERMPSVEADQVIRLGLDLFPLPIIQMAHDDFVNQVSFSPKGNLIVVSGGNNAEVLAVKDKKILFRITHTDAISSILFSADEKKVVSAGFDKTVRVWDVTTGKEILRLELDDLVVSIAVSHNGRWLASADYANTVQIWNIANGKEIARMNHVGTVNSVGFSSNDNWIVSNWFIYESATDTTETVAHVWDISKGKEITLSPYDGWITFSPNGKLAASYDYKYIYVWDMATGVEVSRINAEAVQFINFSPNGEFIAATGFLGGSSGNSAQVYVWSLSTSKEVARLVHDNQVTSISFSPDGDSIATGSLDYTARVWDITTGKEKARMIQDAWVESVSFSPDGGSIAVGTGTTMFLWNLIRQESTEYKSVNAYWDFITFSHDGSKLLTSGYNSILVRKFPEGVELANISIDGYIGINSVGYSADGNRIVWATDNMIHVWDIHAGKEIATFDQQGFVTSTVFSQDGEKILSGSFDKTARVWDIETGKEVLRLKHNDTVRSVSFSPDEKSIVSGSYDASIRVWDAEDGIELFRINADPYVMLVKFSEDGRYIISESNGENDGSARVWDVATEREVARMTHANSVTSVAFSPDGNYVISGGGDKMARVWDASTGTEIARMTHDSAVTSVAFSPDGNYVVSGSADHTARVWDAKTGNEIARMTHDDSVTSVAFSPNGKWVVSASNDKTIRTWLWKPQDLIAEICRRLPRNLTADEWKKYTGNTDYHATCSPSPVVKLQTDYDAWLLVVSIISIFFLAWRRVYRKTLR